MEALVMSAPHTRDVVFECSEKRFVLTAPDTLPADVRRFVEAMRRHNEGYAHGWSSDANKQAILAEVDAVEDLLFPYVRLEVNSAWLDEPGIVEPVQGPIELAADDVGYDLHMNGELKLWLTKTVTLRFAEEVADDDFDDWAAEQHLTDLFMLGLTADVAAEVTAEESSVRLATD